MANTRVGNVIFIDSTGAASTEKGLRVAQILFTTSGAGDAFELRETSAGDTKLSIKHATASDTKSVLQNGELVYFANGIYVQSISASSKLMLILAGATGGSGA